MKQQLGRVLIIAMLSACGADTIPPSAASPTSPSAVVTPSPIAPEFTPQSKPMTPPTLEAQSPTSTPEAEPLVEHDVTWENMTFTVLPGYIWKAADSTTNTLYDHRIIAQGVIIYDPSVPLPSTEGPWGISLMLVEFNGSAAEWANSVASQSSDIDTTSVQPITIADVSGISYDPLVSGTSGIRYYAISVSGRLLVIENTNAGDEQQMEMINSLSVIQ